MNVKEMLLSCDIEQAATLHFAIQEPPACEEWEGFLQVHRDFIEEIADITPITSDNVLLCTNFYIGGKPHSEIRMYCKSELLKNFQRCEAWEEDRLLESYSDAEIKRIAPKTLGYVYPEYFDMELLPWEEVLGVEVFEENLRTVGHDQLAAVVIREMSFWGLSYERSQRGQHEFWERLQETMQEVEEHQYIPAEKVYEELQILGRLDEDDGDDLSMEEETPSGDMHIAFPEITLDYWIRATIAQYRELLRYVVRSSSEVHPTRTKEAIR